MKKDILEIETRNIDLMNKFMGQAVQYFNLYKDIQELLEKCNNLNMKHRRTLEIFQRKLKLHKDKETRWGYDPYRKEFVGFRKPIVGKPEYVERSNDERPDTENK